jgi:CRISPR-associated protein Csb2
VALPATRRRIDPKRQQEDAKPAHERLNEEVQAHNSVRAAIRHAGLDVQVTRIHVQREPLDRRGEHAEKFADGTRFSRHQMWHVEVDFDRPVRGPLVLGDGRFLGLGVMAPAAQNYDGVWVFEVVEGLTSGADAEEIANALRRAVMARSQAALGSRAELPSLISGHAADGSALRDKGHLAFQFDPSSRMLFVLAPHIIEHRAAHVNEREPIKLLDRALEDFSELRAGNSGLLRLARSTLEDGNCALFASAQIWTSSTPYLVTRHAKSNDAKQALAADIQEECVRRGLPIPKSIEVLGVRGITGKGLTGEVRIEFATAVTGPLLLGRSRFCGGGSFVEEKPTEERENGK